MSEVLGEEALVEELSALSVRKEHKSIVALLNTPPITATECQTILDWDLSDAPITIVAQLKKELHKKMDDIVFDEIEAEEWAILTESSMKKFRKMRARLCSVKWIADNEKKQELDSLTKILANEPGKVSKKKATMVEQRIIATAVARSLEIPLATRVSRVLKILRAAKPTSTLEQARKLVAKANGQKTSKKSLQSKHSTQKKKSFKKS